MKSQKTPAFSPRFIVTEYVCTYVSRTSDVSYEAAPTNFQNGGRSCGRRYLVAGNSELAKFGNTMINRNWKGCTSTVREISLYVILAYPSRLGTPKRVESSGSPGHRSNSVAKLIQYVFFFRVKVYFPPVVRKWTPCRCDSLETPTVSTCSEGCDRSRLVGAIVDVMILA